MSSIEHASIPLDGGSLPLTIARGDGRGAAVVIVPSAFGVAPDLEEQMRELASTASVVVAFDPFFRGDAGVVPYDDMRRVMARLGALDRDRCANDLADVLAWTGAPAIVLGICFGGPFALGAVADGLAAGAVTWHGTRLEQHLARAPSIRGPLRLHFGAADPVVPPAAVDAIRAAFADHPDAQIVVHPGATHGFTHRAAPQAYDASAEAAAMAAVRELAGAAGRET
jgi:carboxymethylenebutenolidase